MEQIKRDITFTTYADFCLGMATAWGFAAWEALSRLAWSDLIICILLAIITVKTAITIRLFLAYDKFP